MLTCRPLTLGTLDPGGNRDSEEGETSVTVHRTVVPEGVVLPIRVRKTSETEESENRDEVRRGLWDRNLARSKGTARFGTRDPGRPDPETEK